MQNCGASAVVAFYAIFRNLFFILTIRCKQHQIAIENVTLSLCDFACLLIHYISVLFTDRITVDDENYKIVFFYSASRSRYYSRGV